MSYNLIHVVYLQEAAESVYPLTEGKKGQAPAKMVVHCPLTCIQEEFKHEQSLWIEISRMSSNVKDGKCWQ